MCVKVLACSQDGLEIGIGREERKQAGLMPRPEDIRLQARRSEQSKNSISPHLGGGAHDEGVGQGHLGLELLGRHAVAGVDVGDLLHHLDT